MRLIIEQQSFMHFDDITVHLSLDQIASAFSVAVLFDPDSAEHRSLFEPLRYKRFQLYNDDGDLLITGVILRHSFRSTPTASWLQLSGYSATGVLEDSEVPLECYPLQSNGLTLLEVCQKLTKPFGIDVVVDPLVASVANQKFTATTASDSQSVKAYLAELCAYRGVLLTHDAYGRLLLTKVNTSVTPVYTFASNMQAYEMHLDTDGQRMHSMIGMVRQASKREGGARSQSVLSNPYVPVFRPSVKRQSNGDNEQDTATAARTALAEELRNIQLTIRVVDWYLGGLFVRPGMVVAVHKPELCLHQPTVFVIESVIYRSSARERTAELVCYLPEVYNTETPSNIFTQ